VSTQRVDGPGTTVEWGRAGGDPLHRGRDIWCGARQM
jgi:hypothetical protein